MRPHHDHGTAGIVHALAQQVLTETSALAFDHIGQRLERTLVGACHGLAATTVIQQRVYRLLQHTLLVAHNNFRRLQLKQTFQTVVTVDHTTIQIVQVRSRKTTTVQRYQRTQLWRQHRQYFQNHPLRLDTGLNKGFKNFQTLGVFFDFCFGAGRFQLSAQRDNFSGHIQGAQQRANTLCSHHCRKFIAILFQLGEIVILGQQLAAIKRG